MEYSSDVLKDLTPYAIPIAIALVISVIFLGLLGRVRGRIVRRQPQHRKEIDYIVRFIRWAVLLIILMTSLEAMNVPLGNVWTAVSTVIALVAIGFFAVWSILSHMTASVVLFLQKPFRYGQFIQFADEDYAGRVVKTGLFYTTVEDPDGGRSQIPNNTLFQKRFRVTDKMPELPAPEES